MQLTKSRLAIILSKLQPFEKPKANLEQYNIDSETCSSILWEAYMIGDIEGKIVLDMGAGTGIIGCGALLLGAKKAYFVDVDEDALGIAKKNIQTVLDMIGNDAGIKPGAEVFSIKVKDVKDLEAKDFAKNTPDIILMNPPFGVQQKHADRLFLLCGMKLAPVIYSMHKTESLRFLDSLSSDNGFKITHKHKFAFPIKQTQSFHKRRIYRFECLWLRFEKNV